MLGIFGGLSDAVAAEIGTAPPQQVVRIGDLNLRNTKGVAVAYGRLHWAAERVCPFADSADYWLRSSAASCVVRAISEAVDSIGSPLLRAYAQSQPLFRLQQAQASANHEAPASTNR